MHTRPPPSLVLEHALRGVELPVPVPGRLRVILRPPSDGHPLPVSLRLDREAYEPIECPPTSAEARELAVAALTDAEAAVIDGLGTLRALLRRYSPSIAREEGAEALASWLSALAEVGASFEAKDVTVDLDPVQVAAAERGPEGPRWSPDPVCVWPIGLLLDRRGVLRRVAAEVPWCTVAAMERACHGRVFGRDFYLDGLAFYGPVGGWETTEPEPSVPRAVEASGSPADPLFAALELKLRRYERLPRWLDTWSAARKPSESEPPCPGALVLYLMPGASGSPFRLELLREGPDGPLPPLACPRRPGRARQLVDGLSPRELRAIDLVGRISSGDLRRKSVRDLARELLTVMPHLDVRFEGVPVKIARNPKEVWLSRPQVERMPRGGPVPSWNVSSVYVWPELGLLLDETLELRPLPPQVPYDRSVLTELSLWLEYRLYADVVSDGRSYIVAAHLERERRTFPEPSTAVVLADAARWVGGARQLRGRYETEPRIGDRAVVYGLRLTLGRAWAADPLPYDLEVMRTARDGRAMERVDAPLTIEMGRRHGLWLPPEEEQLLELAGRLKLGLALEIPDLRAASRAAGALLEQVCRTPSVQVRLYDQDLDQAVPLGEAAHAAGLECEWPTLPPARLEERGNLRVERPTAPGRLRVNLRRAGRGGFDIGTVELRCMGAQGDLPPIDCPRPASGLSEHEQIVIRTLAAERKLGRRGERPWVRTLGDSALPKRFRSDLLKHLAHVEVYFEEHRVEIDLHPIGAWELRGIFQDDSSPRRGWFPLPLAISGAWGLLLDEDCVLRPIDDTCDSDLVEIARHRASEVQEGILEHLDDCAQLELPRERPGRTDPDQIDKYMEHALRATAEEASGPKHCPEGMVVVHIPSRRDVLPDHLRVELRRYGGDPVHLGAHPTLARALAAAGRLIPREEPLIRMLGAVSKLLDVGFRQDVAGAATELLGAMIPVLDDVPVYYEGVRVHFDLTPLELEDIFERPRLVWRLAGLVLDSDLVLRPLAAGVSREQLGDLWWWSVGGARPGPRAGGSATRAIAPASPEPRMGPPGPAERSPVSPSHELDSQAV